MAIDISKIENLFIDEGTEAAPFILTDAEVTTLYRLAISGNPAITIKGYVNTVTGTILKYEAYQLKKAWPELVILAREVTTQDWTVQLLSNTITEREETKLLATNISTETLEWRIDDVSLSVISGSYGEGDVRAHLHFDKLTGRVYYDMPTSNAGWVANVSISFWPSYIENPEPADYRTVFLTIRAIAVTAVEITAPSRIDEGATISIKLTPYPANNSKSPEGCKYSISTAYGLLSPSSGAVVDRTEFVYYAPMFKDVPYSEDEEGKYFMHNFVAAFYMYGSTTPSGTTSCEMLMKNTTFKVTCDTDHLLEGERATFDVLGYTWAEVQKTLVIDELKLQGITEEELRRRVVFENGPFFSMLSPTDNATFTADVKLYIAPPGAEPLGERAFVFNMNLKAIGVTSVSLSPQTIGQNIPSVITIAYKPAIHTKGELTYGFECDGVTVSRRDDINGIYNVFSPDISPEGVDATAFVYSPYVGRETPLVTATTKLYVQDIYFNVTFDGAEQRETSIDEGEEIPCFIDILHISELRQELTINITRGADVIDENFIRERLHFSEDTSTDKIWFDGPDQNISWSADISIRFVARYIPEGSEPPYSQTVLIHVDARAVTGIEWQKEDNNNSNFTIATTPYRKTSYICLKTIPADNTKQATLENLYDSPFSVAAVSTGFSLNQVVPNGRYAATANIYGDWYIHGYGDIFSTNHIVTTDTFGKTTQEYIPSTSLICYPEHLVLSKDRDTTLELRKIDDLYTDSYVLPGEGITPVLFRRVGKLILSETANIEFTDEGAGTENSVCFYITLVEKASGVGLNKVISSHFAATENDISSATNDEVDTIINAPADKLYIRISNEAIGVTDYTLETEETYREKILAYLQAQREAGTPVTVFYPLANETSEEIEEPLYRGNVFFAAPTYHMYTANDPNNQCSIEFLNNDTTATKRIVFNVEYPIDDDDNKFLETLVTPNIRSTSAEISDVHFFAGEPTSIDQYDEDGNLITDANGNAEKGEINIWENFAGKYEEWKDDEFIKINWDFVGETEQEPGMPTPDAPKYCTHRKFYTETGEQVEFKGHTWASTFYGDRYESATKILRSNFGVYVFTGTENISVQSGRIRANSMCFEYSPYRKKSTGISATFFCSHFEPTSAATWSADNETVWNKVGDNSGSSYLYFNIRNELVGITDYTQETTATAKAKAQAWLAAQYEAGTPVTLWYPLNQEETPLQDREYYTFGNIHRRYTISKIPTDDDRDGDYTKQNKFNGGFVQNEDGSLPNRFFLSRFIPGWHDNDNTSIISLAKGLKSQQRTISKENVLEKGCYYKDDKGNLKQIAPIYYGPLLAYSWLAYMTYGTLNLKDVIGVGASKISAEAKIFADDSGTPLTPGQAYSSVYIINNGFLNEDTYENYDFNIIGAADNEIATKPITSFKIKTVAVGSIYTVVTLKHKDGSNATYTAVTPTDYYSLNSCFSETGYTEDTYLDEDGNSVVSGYGIDESKYSDTRHPVRCLNVENMWGGGAYTIGGTGFIADETDSSIAHPVMWQPEEGQDPLDNTTWSKLTDVTVVPKIGTWDVGGFKYHNGRCAWVNEPAELQVPYRGYNVYNRPASLVQNAVYAWDTGTYNDWAEPSDFQSMCGLGHTNMVHDNSSDYQFVEYLESTGSQWIKTGQGFTPADEVYARAAIFRNTNSDYTYFMTSNPWGEGASQLFSLGGWWARQNGWGFGYGNGTAYYGAGQTQDNEPHEFYYKDGVFSIKDLGLSKLATATFATISNEIYLFGGYRDTPIQTGARIYEVWHKRDGFYLYNMVPCYRKADRKPGMYDKITGQFFTNAATSGADFLLGPEKNTDMYQTVDYIQATGSQYIDLDYKPKANTKIVTKFSKLTTTLQTLFGSGNATDTVRVQFFRGTNAYGIRTFGNGVTSFSDPILDDNNELTFDLANDQYKLNNEIITAEKAPTTVGSLFVFAYNSAGIPATLASAKLYSFKIYESNVLVRDYIPVYNKVTSEYGLYDTINHKFYKGQGANKLTGAAVVVPVDFVWTTGKQFIDTGWKYKPNSRVDITTLRNSDGKANKIFGNDESATNMFDLSLYNTDSSNSMAANIKDKNVTNSSVSQWYHMNIVLEADSELGYSYQPQRCGNPKVDNTNAHSSNIPTTHTRTCLLGNFRDTNGQPATIGSSMHRIYRCDIVENEEVDRVYEKLEYISMNNYCQINTRFYPSSNTKVETKQLRKDSSWTPFYGHTTRYGTASFGIYSGGAWHAFNNDNSTSLGITQNNVIYKIVQDGNKYYTDDVLKYTAPAATFQATTVPLCINTNDNHGFQADHSGNGQVYYMKIWDNNVLMRDMIPARDTVTGKVGLYDFVTDRFFTSTNRVECVAGPDLGETFTGKALKENLVRRFNPVYNVIEQEYGFYDAVGKQYYGNLGTGQFEAGGEVQEVEWIENSLITDPDKVAMLSDRFHIDVEVFAHKTGKVEVDMDVVKQSVNMHNICIGGTTGITSQPRTYLCYSDLNQSGFTIQERTQEGSKVTWTYQYADDAYLWSTMTICGYGTTSSTVTTNDWTGLYHYKGVKIYAKDRTTLLRDLVPARVGVHAGLYDKVTGQMFFNSNPSYPYISYGPDVTNNKVPGDPGIKSSDAIVELTRIFGTL